MHDLCMSVSAGVLDSRNSRCMVLLGKGKILVGARTMAVCNAYVHVCVVSMQEHLCCVCETVCVT